MRDSLPFREKTELFLLNRQGNIVAEDHKKYIMFPGGGIDEHETDRVTSAIRELEEEVHMTVDGILLPQSSVSWIWFPEWADNNKRQERYAQFQGERVHLFCGTAKPLSGPLKHEEDTWKNQEGIHPEECIGRIIENAKKDHPNTYAYRIAQLAAIRTTCILANRPILIPTIDIRSENTSFLH